MTSRPAPNDPSGSTAGAAVRVTRTPTGAAPGHDPDTRRPSVRGPRALLGLRGFRLLVTIRLLSALGDGAFQGALAGAVLFSPERQTDAAAIAGGFAVLLLPYSIVGPFAGALLDRWSRRQVLVRANVLRSAIVVVVAVAIALDAATSVLFVIALFVMGTSRFVGSGQSASVPHTVPDDSLTGANSLGTTVGSLATLIGSGIAFGLRALIGDTHVPIAFVTASVVIFYLLSAATAARFDRHALGPDVTDEPRQPMLAVLQGLGSGLRHMVKRRSIGLHICVVVLVRFGFGMATLLVLLLFQNYFRGNGIFASGIVGIGQVLAVSGFGLLLGAVTTSYFTRLFGIRRYITLLLVVCGIVVLAAGSQFTEPMTMLTAFFLAFGYQSTKVCADTIAQADADDAYVGRVFAVYDTASNVFYVAAFALGVLLVPPDGHGLAAPITLGAVYLLGAVLYWWGSAHAVRHPVLPKA
ncbi:MFS transporter [Nakamurella sp. A5-74]|uniref:MFS transporter n=1 Tax=Nakamurella sp. A5-74 TaxID=3158264 RepID=A0AAU8DPX9_9ACTN